jgi:superfamily II DNA helicase RecQ
MRLILPGHVPYVTATATANLLTREAIRQVLRFGEDSLTVNLGNYRPNLAYSVHRLKKAKASLAEILHYFQDKTRLPGYTLIFVDSRPIGQIVLFLLRQHVVPSLRHKIQIYHAFRSDKAKEILVNGFEKDGGFQVMICTEAMTLVRTQFTN